jgi:hypothetical protein
MASSFDNVTGMPLQSSLMLNAGDFEFTPLPTTQVAFGEAVTGYAITSQTGPQTITSPPNGYSIALVGLSFSVVSRDGDIVGAGVGGSMIALSGPGYSLSLLEADDLASGGFVSARDFSGSTTRPQNVFRKEMPPTAIPLSLSFSISMAAALSGSATTDFSFFTATPVPEPNSLIALTTVLGFCAFLLVS